MEWRYGTPSAEEWNGPWKSSEGDADFGDVDEAAGAAMAQRLRELGNTDFPDYDFYFREDYYVPDRTQYLEIVRPESLTPALLAGLQALLREPQFSRWRIVGITYLGPAETPIIYPTAIRIGAHLSALPPDRVAETLSAKMKQRKGRAGAGEG